MVGPDRGQALSSGAHPPASSKPSTSRRRYSRWHLDSRVEGEEDGWLLTYLDVITLMLVMMVVMLSVAGPPGPHLSPKQDGAAPNAAASTTPTNSIVPPLPLPVAQPAPPKVDPLKGLKLDQLGKDIDVAVTDDMVRFRISSELLFDSGSASLSPAGLAVLDQLVPTLTANPTLRLVVEGHTDSVPIHTDRFPSNWELSTARAASVARHLVEQGVAPQRMQATGFADTRPLGGKDNPVDQVANRRVELAMEKPGSERPVR